MKIIKEFAAFSPKWTTTTTDNSVSFRSTSTARVLDGYAGSTTRKPRWVGQAMTAKPSELHKKTQPAKGRELPDINIGALLVFRNLLDMADELGYYVTPNDKEMFDNVPGIFEGGSHLDQLMAYLLSGGVITIECEDEDGETVMSELDVQDVSRGMENAPMDCVIRLVSDENDELDVDTALRSVVDAGKKI